MLLQACNESLLNATYEQLSKDDLSAQLVSSTRVRFRQALRFPTENKVQARAWRNMRKHWITWPATANTVTAATIRDAFISGLYSSHIISGALHDWELKEEAMKEEDFQLSSDKS